MPSLPFCMGMAFFCHSVKSPARETVVAAGEVKRKVWFLGFSANSLAIANYPFLELGLVFSQRTSRPARGRLLERSFARRVQSTQRLPRSVQLEGVCILLATRQ